MNGHVHHGQAPPPPAPSFTPQQGCGSGSTGGLGSPQGKFIQRLCQLEEANKRLIEEVQGLKAWKDSVEEYLKENLGFFPQFNGTAGTDMKICSHHLLIYVHIYQYILRAGAPSARYNVSANYHKPRLHLQRTYYLTLIT
jgi:hypothetical protein